MITLEQFNDLFPNVVESELWVQAMQEEFPRFDITTPLREAAFLTQCGHECGGWRVFEENLNYSQQGLMVTFRRYFPTPEIAAEYARKPEQIASRVYAFRMGNGPEASGDGWTYRGRGPLQLTGKDNYGRFSAEVLGSPSLLINEPDLVKTDKNIGLKSALWFWNTNRLNKPADFGDVEQMTRRINGGMNGFAERKTLYNKALEILT